MDRQKGGGRMGELIGAKKSHHDTYFNPSFKMYTIINHLNG